MPSPLTIPGVQVRTLFEPAPVLPGATGILGLAGVTDRGPTAPTMVGSFGEFIDLFGSASAYTMPEARTAFANGVAMLVVARTRPGRGQKATLELTDDEGEKVVVLEARAEGEWANKIGVRIAQIKTLGGLGVKCVDIELALDGQVIETLSNLVMDSDSPDYLFDRINQGSKLVVATDPLFGTALPVALARLTLTSLGPWQDTGVALVAAAAVAGHVFPLYLGFKGGKAVATTFGVVAVLAGVALTRGRPEPVSPEPSTSTGR